MDSRPSHAEAMDSAANCDRVTGIVIDIHRRLGPGLLESVDQEVPAYELRKRGLRVRTEVPVPVTWKSVDMDVGFRADLVVEDFIIVESIARVHKKQLLMYLRLADKRVGVLINFGAELLCDGIHRVVHGPDESPIIRHRERA